ncbi:MAG TPA: hypothetical protein VHG08_23100 [Longimicrobium sp.]|nr:hypothetical protein [Longimicrobium sp.]
MTIRLPAAFLLTLLAAACAGGATPRAAPPDASAGLDGLRYGAQVAVLRDSLVARANLVNAGRAPVALEYGDCALLLRAWRSPEARGEPAWRSELRGPFGTGLREVCGSLLRTATLAPGDSLPRPLQLRVPLLDVLGDSLPDGRYWFTGVLQLNSGESAPFPAGDGVLAARRPPLEPFRTADETRFDAETQVSEGAVVATVVGRMVEAGSTALRMSEACPVVLYVYRTREEREAAPRAAVPAWVSHRDCPPGEVRHSLNRGEQRTWRVRAPVRAVLGDTLPDGRYFFAVAVNHAPHRFFLAAGEAMLTR